MISLDYNGLMGVNCFYRQVLSTKTLLRHTGADAQYQRNGFESGTKYPELPLPHFEKQY